jgi:hypothetical protein
VFSCDVSNEFVNVLNEFQVSKIYTEVQYLFIFQ